MFAVALFASTSLSSWQKRLRNAHLQLYDEPPSDAVEASGRKLDELHTELGRYQFPLLQLQTLQVAPLPL